MAEAQTVDIGRALRILWHNAWILVLMVLLGGGGAYFWATRQTTIYEATSLVRAVDLTTASGSSNAKVDAQRAVDIQVLYAKSQTVVDEFDQRMGADKGRIKSTDVSAASNADALSIVVQATSATAAQDGATNYAAAYIDRERAALATSFNGQATALRARAADVQKQLAALDTQITQLQKTDGAKVEENGGRAVVIPPTERLQNLSVERNTLSQKYADLLDQADQAVADGSTQQASVDFVQKPTRPSTPVSPTKNLDAGVGALAGLLVGIGLVILRNRLRGRVVTSDDVKAAAAEIPFVLAVPPNGAKGRRRSAPGLDSVNDDEGHLAEAYRSLGAWMRLANKSHSVPVVLVTSGLAAEGKTSVATNLAVSLAQAGERVLVVDCDLRHPNVHDVFGVPNEIGYSSVVSRSAPLDHAIVRVTVPAGSLDVLPAGPLMASPTQLLLSRDADTLFAELKRRYDYVVVDSSPILPVADALTLSRSVDQVLVVVSAGRTRTSEFTQAMQLLRQFGAPVRGGALVGARHEPTSSTYGYPLNYASGKKRKRGHRAPAAARVEPAPVEPTPPPGPPPVLQQPLVTPPPPPVTPPPPPVAQLPLEPPQHYAPPQQPYGPPASTYDQSQTYLDLPYPAQPAVPATNGQPPYQPTGPEQPPADHAYGPPPPPGTAHEAADTGVIPAIGPHNS